MFANLVTLHTLSQNLKLENYSSEQNRPVLEFFLQCFLAVSSDVSRLESTQSATF
jgi:hypothetical protein